MTSYNFSVCPVCNNNSVEPGEWVEHMKVTPDRCDVCGWQESNYTPAYPPNFEFVNKCWELQVAPYPFLRDAAVHISGLG